MSAPLKPTLVLAGAMLFAVGGASDAQSTDSTRRAPTVRRAMPGNYSAGELTRALLGSGWRDVWTTPVTEPVLSLDDWGLVFEKRGGGNQSVVLHLDEKDGWREYRFRSVNKFPSQGFPVFRGTAFGALMQDQVSAYFPAAPLMVPPLLESIGALTVEPSLMVMGDAPSLGALRDTVVGTLGTMELKADEGPDDAPGFAGSKKIKDTEAFLADIDSSRAHRLDEREFLAVRLVDMLINDPDRTPDNFSWVRFGDDGAYVWRPLARDRDQAFIDARGLVNSLIVRRVFPKQLPFDDRYRLGGLTYSSHVLDRRLLQRLTRQDFTDVAARVQRAVSDAVIGDAVGQLPRAWRDGTTAGARLERVLRARRDRIPQLADEFYRWLASEVDVHGTADADRIDVVRHADGRVSVTIGDPIRAPLVAERADGRVVTTSGGDVAPTGDDAPWYRRTFDPAETREVRIYAGAGDDVAVVRGALADAITVRIIGDAGNDVLADSVGGRTALYDAEGDNRFIPSGGTRVDLRAWKPVEPVVGFRFGTDWVPDWGRKQGWTPAFDYNTGSGLILGVGRRMTAYGFRRLPYHWQAGANLMVGTGDGRIGLDAYADIRAENAPRAFRIEARATQLEATRFFGYGNDTPDIGRAGSLVEQTVYAVEPSLVRLIGWRARESDGNPIRGDSGRYAGLRPLEGELRLGATASWIDPDPGVSSALATAGVTGAEAFGVAGARVALELDRTDDDAVPTSGFRFDADAAAYPALDLDEPFGTAEARGAAYVPLGARGGPHLALRIGGALALGEYPAQFAAALGGRSSLRGYTWRRFAGDAAVNAGAELRVPLGTVNLLVRSQLGVFALADAGRVWFDGESAGGMHRSLGGGLWLSAFGKALSLAYAQGEGGRVYLRAGLPY